jgi:hypothetical protein
MNDIYKPILEKLHELHTRNQHTHNKAEPAPASQTSHDTTEELLTTIG